MSAETDYLQHFLNLFEALWQNPILRRYNLTLGLSITATEANQDIVDPRFQDTMGPTAPPQGPGQTSYARGVALAYTDLGHATTAPGISLRTSLTFREVDRFYAFTGDRHLWWTVVPFSGGRIGREQVTISLVPFVHHHVGVPIEPDGQVHVQVTYPDRPGAVTILESGRLEPNSQQLLATTGSQDAADTAALWVISFFLAARAPG